MIRRLLGIAVVLTFVFGFCAVETEAGLFKKCRVKRVKCACACAPVEVTACDAVLEIEEEEALLPEAEETAVEEDVALLPEAEEEAALDATADDEELIVEPEAEEVFEVEE